VEIQKRKKERKLQQRQVEKQIDGFNVKVNGAMASVLLRPPGSVTIIERNGARIPVTVTEVQMVGKGERRFSGYTRTGIELNAVSFSRPHEQCCERVQQARTAIDKALANTS